MFYNRSSLLVNDQIGIRDGDHKHVVEGLCAARAQGIRGLIRVRDAVRRCLRAQIEAEDEILANVARLQLNQAYDRFIAKFGPISERANTAAFRGDPDLPLLLSSTPTCNLLIGLSLVPIRATVSARLRTNSVHLETHDELLHPCRTEQAAANHAGGLDQRCGPLNTIRCPDNS